MLANAIIQEYYRLLFEEFAQMKRSKQKEEKDCALKIVFILNQIIVGFWHLTLISFKFPGRTERKRHRVKVNFKSAQQGDERHKAIAQINE